MDITIPNTFTGNKLFLKELLTDLKNKDTMRNIAYYVGLMNDGAYHVYLVPQSDEADYNAAATLVKAKISSGEFNSKEA